MVNRRQHHESEDRVAGESSLPNQENVAMDASNTAEGTATSEEIRLQKAAIRADPEANETTPPAADRLQQSRQNP